MATHGSNKGGLVVKGRSETKDEYFQADDVHRTHSSIGQLRPDLVVLNSCSLIADSYLLDNVDSIIQALLSCGECSGVCPE